MKELQFRNKITWFSFAFTLLVVWIHACNAELFLGQAKETAWLFDLESFMVEGIGQIAVPGFFMISGYLFFRDFDLSRLEGKWERRIKSTLVPYILWNFLYYAGYVAASRLPGISRVVGKGTISIDLDEFIAAILHFKYNPVFWYMFQLILLILLAPVIYLFIKSFLGRAVLFIILGLLLVLDIYLPFLNTDALFYYSLAGALALDKKTRAVCEAPEGSSVWKVTGIAAILAAIAFYCLGNRTFMPVCFVICRILIITGLWLLIPAKALPRPGWVVSEHFFLYATHFAFVRLINKSVDILLPAVWHVWEVPFILFMAMPFLCLAISSAIYAVFRFICPGLCRLLNGGRQ